jgi:hypothetical protein
MNSVTGSGNVANFSNILQDKGPDEKSNETKNSHDIRLSVGHGPSGRPELGPLLEKALNRRSVSTADGPVQRPHAVQVHVLHVGPVVEEKVDNFRIALVSCQIKRRST